MAESYPPDKVYGTMKCAHLFTNERAPVNCDILPERCNSDKFVNMNGTNLIELCKAFDLAIVNGRIGDDISGKFTFANLSTIDYCLISRESFKLVENFEVDEFDETISDKHNAIRVYLNIESKIEEDNIELVSTTNEDSHTDMTDKVRIVWDKSLL